MTVSVNGKPDVLTMSDVWALCRAHNEIGLTSDQVGAFAVGEEPDDLNLLAQEAEMIKAARPELTNACDRILAALDR
jgi:hypothetical protein